MEDDSDMAFDLQMEEALAASHLDGAVAFLRTLQNDIVSKDDPELLDQYTAEAETERLRLDLCRQVHDRAFACEILNVPEEEWKTNGDNLSRPYGEGSSSPMLNGKGLRFRVYVKGLMEGMSGGIGVAICDENDGLVFEVSKGLSGKDQQVNQEVVELKTLIEGLDAALMLDVKRVTIFTDNQWLYENITGKTHPMAENVAALRNQIGLLLRKLSDNLVSLVPSNDIKFAFELARKAIAVQVNRSAGNSNAVNRTTCCTICMEDTYADQMFLITSCQHTYCFSCMSKHVQFKLLQGTLPKCPYEKCKTELKLDNCKKFLSSELLEIMSQRVKEASIPPAERIYCPYPKCSTLLSKTELQRSTSSSIKILSIKCPRCSGFFCINCKVPWHDNMNCHVFKMKNPSPSNEDQKLKNLATQSLWRQCPKCDHMVSLGEGCYHIYCRCGHEFCYTCGKEWKNKRASCTCPIWDERNIVYDR
ncbi:hypothetical protein ACS0TY_014678 [Phlomoides rotata]